MYTRRKRKVQDFSGASAIAATERGAGFDSATNGSGDGTAQHTINIGSLGDHGPCLILLGWAPSVVLNSVTLGGQPVQILRQGGVSASPTCRAAICLINNGPGSGPLVLNFASNVNGSVVSFATLTNLQLLGASFSNGTASAVGDPSFGSFQSPGAGGIRFFVLCMGNAGSGGIWTGATEMEQEENHNSADICISTAYDLGDDGGGISIATENTSAVLIGVSLR